MFIKMVEMIGVDGRDFFDINFTKPEKTRQRAKDLFKTSV